MSASAHFTLTDLLSDPDFRSWVKSGAYKKSGNYWSAWRRQNPVHEETVSEAIDMLLASHVDEVIAEHEVDQIINGTWERIENQEESAQPLLRWWWAAASVILLLAGIWITTKRTGNQIRELSQRTSQIDFSRIIERANSGTKPMLIILPDSSSVVILPGSELRFPVRFSENAREVQLAGEAFFEISKNAAKPFFVHTKTITTRVVGTSFSVRSFDGEPDVNVIVKTGKVSVYQKSTDSQKVPQNAVVLLPKQNISYNKEKHLMSQSVTAAASTPFVLKNASFEFVDAPVTAILDSIGNAYGLKMEYNAANLKKCILTTSLTDTPLQGKLKIICRALGRSAAYKISDTGIEISGRGCE